jgi:chromosome segregation ATPase
MRNGILVYLITAALLAGATGFAEADENKSGREQELLHRAQEQIQQLQQDNMALQRARLGAEEKLKAMTDQLDDSRKDIKTVRAHSAGLNDDLKKMQDIQAALVAKLEETNGALAAMTQKQTETAALVTRRDAELKAAGEAIEQNKNNTLACEARNETLYQYDQALLEHYENKGVWAALIQREPFVGAEKVEIEKTVQQYRDKLAAERIRKP